MLSSPFKAAIACALILAVGSAWGSSAKVQISRQYKRWAHAALTNDVATVLAILTPDYTLRTYKGKTVA
jgi:hypothetical protein